MIRCLVISFLVCFSIIINAQESQNEFDSILAKKTLDSLIGSSIDCDYEKTFSIIEQMPIYENDLNDKDLDKFVSKTVRYPKYSTKNEITGNVIIEFIVNEDGSFSCPRITSSPHIDLSIEAIRVFYLMHKWHPGKQGGKPVKCLKYLTVKFRIQE